MLKVDRRESLPVKRLDKDKDIPPPPPLAPDLAAPRPYSVSEVLERLPQAETPDTGYLTTVSGWMEKAYSALGYRPANTEREAF